MNVVDRGWFSRETDTWPTTPVTAASSGDVAANVVVGDLTLTTTDSGIGSIAQRPTRRIDSGRRRRLVDSHVLSGASSTDDDDEEDVDDEALSAGESTGLSDVDVALMWHCARCSEIVEVLTVIMPRHQSGGGIKQRCPSVSPSVYSMHLAQNG